MPSDNINAASQSAISFLTIVNSPLARRMSLHHALTYLRTSLTVTCCMVPDILPSQLEILSMGQTYFETAELRLPFFLQSCE